MIREEAVKKKKPWFERIKAIFVESSYVQEQVVNNGEIESLSLKNLNAFLKHDELPGFTYTREDEMKADGINTHIDNLRKIYEENNKSIDETYEYLINEIKQNPDNITVLIQYLTQSLKFLYDQSMKRLDLGTSGEEVLRKILETPVGENVDGLICSEIHAFAMKVLHDCDIPAVVLSGGVPSQAGHATLLYQTHDGKYVYTNYGDTAVINASSLIDAAKVIYSSMDCQLESAGFITFIDNNNSYNKFALEQEALWAAELDKFNSNKDTVFDNQIADDCSKVILVGDFSNLNNVNVDMKASFLRKKNKYKDEISISTGYKDNNKTTLFESSNAKGVKLEYKNLIKNNDNTETFINFKGILQAFNGKRSFFDKTPTDYRLFDNQESFNQAVLEYCMNQNFEVEDITFPNIMDLNPVNLQEKYKENGLASDSKGEISFAEATINHNIKLFETSKLSIENASGINFNRCFYSCIGPDSDSDSDSDAFFGKLDRRLKIENGTKLTVENKNIINENYITAGYVGDSKNTCGEQKIGIQSGVKLNVGTLAEVKLNENIAIGTQVEAYSVALKPYQDYGYFAKIYGNYDLNKKDCLYGMLAYTHEKQDLNIGGFTGTSQEESSLGVALGVRVDKADAFMSYKKSINNVNHTYDNSMLSFGLKLNF